MKFPFILLLFTTSLIVADEIPTSGLRINEFAASNSSSLDDGDGNSSDWIELYNAGPDSVDLSGWFLTDSNSKLKKWEFPAGINLARNAHLIVFASGREVDDYQDAGGFFHTNFKLSGNGEFLALVRPDGSTIQSQFAPEYPAQFTDVSYGTYAEPSPLFELTADRNAEVFIPTDGTLGESWTSSAFVPDASWITPATGSGVGFDSSVDYRPYIEVDIGDAMRSIGTSAYLRLPFELSDATIIAELSLDIRYDDGFTAYLNGTEVASRNSPANPVWDSVASDNVDEDNNFETIDLSAFSSALQDGENVLAIHGLNRSAGSSDFLIDATLNARVAPSGPLLNGYLAATTPGTANTGGAAFPGPAIVEVLHSPLQPSASQDLIITAIIAPRLVAVEGAILTYRVQYEDSRELIMVDDGSGADVTAGDSIFTATIPASTFDPEEMIRWSVTARDTSDNPTRAPAFLDQVGKKQSPEYFGTVVADPSVSSDLDLFQWFTRSVPASHTRSGTRASIFFRGRFYDNVFVRQRGGFTNASASQKFTFNRGHSFQVNEELSSLGEININGNGVDPTFIRQPLSFDTHRAADNESSLSFLWQLRVNGRRDRVGIAIEQVDEDFLERNNFDPEGDLYKFVQRSNLNPVFFDTTTGVEKKTGDLSNLDSLADLVNGLKLPTSAQRRQYIIDHLDLHQIVNYLAARSVIQDADDLRKNFYMYFDARGDRRWCLFPWDKDFTFGIIGDGGTHLPHPFFGDEEHKKQNANQWNILYDVIFEEEVTQRMYLRRLRTLMDEVLQPVGTPVNDRLLERMADDLIDPASPPLGPNINSIKSYLNSRRNVLFNNYPSLIPATGPSMPAIVIKEVEANPAGGNQRQEFIRIQNNEDTEIDLSGWTLDGGVGFTFRPGTVIERNGDLFLTPDSREFLARTTSPMAGEEFITAGPYSGRLSNFSEVLELKDENGTLIDSFVTPNAPSDPQLFLVISEVMYHPASPNNNAEYLELTNVSESVTLDLSGVSFTAGIDFIFPQGSTLAPGARTLVVLDQSAFESVHGEGLPIAGIFQNASRLNNGSDRIKLEDANNSTIQEFTYNDEAPWPTGPDGGGFSLVLVNPGSSPDPDEAASWRESALPGGDPGNPDSTFFTGDPNADPDGDGLSSLLEYAFGTPPNLANGNPLEIAIIDGRVVIKTPINQQADDLAFLLQSSTDLTTWTDASEDLALTSRSNDGDGTSTLTFQSGPDFLSSGFKNHFRLKVILRP